MVIRRTDWHSWLRGIAACFPYFYFFGKWTWEKERLFFEKSSLTALMSFSVGPCERMNLMGLSFLGL